MQRCLVRAKVNMHFLIGKPFPKVNHISLICKRNDFFCGAGFPDAGHEFIKVLMYLIYPALLIAFACSQWIYFRDNTDYTGYDSCLWLGT